MLQQAFSKAFTLILGIDQSLFEIVFLSLKVSGLALLIATIIGFAITIILELFKSPFKGITVTIINTFTGLPPVVVGLGLYIILSRSGPLGFLSLLYSPAAMVIAQVILAVPIVASVSHAAVSSTGNSVRQTALCLGATRFQAISAVLLDARYSLMASVINAFGRVMAEVGAVLIVGGNIAHYTRVMTTAIAMETDRGDFELAIALGIILLALSFCINLFFYSMQRKGAKR